MISTILLLLVEDETLIRELLETALTEAGFELTVATDGEQALAELATQVGFVVCPACSMAWG